MKIDHWLFLRGLVRESRHWGEFVPHFQKLLPKSQIHFLDFPGIGSEKGRCSPHTVEDLVLDLKTRWDKMRVATQGNWGLVSISLGSMVALDWSARHPQNFAAIVIMNTSAANVSPPWKRLRPGTLPVLLKSQRQPTLELREEYILNCTTRLIKNKTEIAKKWSEFSLDTKSLRPVALRQLKAALLFKCPDCISVPSLALLSKGDQFTDFQCTLSIAQKLNSAVEIHPTAGHDLPLDDPDWVSQKIKLWVESR